MPEVERAGDVEEPASVSVLIGPERLAAHNLEAMDALRNESPKGIPSRVGRRTFEDRWLAICAPASNSEADPSEAEKNRRGRGCKGNSERCSNAYGGSGE